MSNASEEVTELMILGFSVLASSIFGFIHLRDTFLGFDPDLSYVTVALYVLALISAVCLIRFQFDKEKRLSPIT